MAGSVLATRPEPFSAVSGHRGKPRMVNVRATEVFEARIEVAALREELRTLGRLSPFAAAIHRYVSTIGESIEAEQMAAAVARYLARAARRHP